MATYVQKYYKHNKITRGVRNLEELYMEMIEEAIPRFHVNQSRHKEDHLFIADIKENHLRKSGVVKRGDYRLDYEGLTTGQTPRYGRFMIQVGSGNDSLSGNAAQVHVQCATDFTRAEVQHAFGISITNRVICELNP